MVPIAMDSPNTVPASTSPTLLLVTYTVVNETEIYLQHFVAFLRPSGKCQDSRHGLKEVTTSSFHAPSHAVCCYYYLVPGRAAGDVAKP